MSSGTEIVTQTARRQDNLIKRTELTILLSTNKDRLPLFGKRFPERNSLYLLNYCALRKSTEGASPCSTSWKLLKKLVHLSLYRNFILYVRIFIYLPKLPDEDFLALFSSLFVCKLRWKVAGFERRKTVKEKNNVYPRSECGNFEQVRMNFARRRIAQKWTLYIM